MTISKSVIVMPLMGLVWFAIVGHADVGPEPKVASAGTVNLSSMPDSQWPAAALKEIASLGSMAAIKGGVTHTVVYNQRSGEDCWSFALNAKIESFLIGQGLHGAQLKLSPEYVNFWHIYDQILNHLSEFQALANEIKADPNTKETRALIAHIKEVYGVEFSGHSRRSAHAAQQPDDHELFAPDVGNEAPAAIAEILKYGIAPYRVVKTQIKTDDQEKKLETTIGQIAGQMIVNAAKGKIQLDSYKEDGRGGINESLFALLKSRLDPIFNASMIRPSDTWVFAGRTYTPLSELDHVKAHGLELQRDWRTFTATPETHAIALKAIAIALLTDRQPVPIGIALLADKVNAKDETTLDFAKATGLFSSSACKQPACQVQDGSHEILVVNFIAQMEDGRALGPDLSAAAQMALIRSGKAVVKGLIIQNSWGPGGLTIDGRAPNARFKHISGYYILTSDYLLNTGLGPINDMYDFVLPTSVAAQFTELKAE